MSAFSRLLRPVAVMSGLVLALGLAPSAQSGKTPMVPHFEWDPTWPKPLAGGRILGNVIGVATDARDHIWVLNRPSSITEQERGAGFNLPDAPCCFPAPPVIEFDQAGNYIQGWGGPGPDTPWVDSEHGLFVDHKDNVWIGSPSDSQLLKYSRTGKFLLRLGEPGHKEGTSTNPKILGGPAAWVDAATNELFVADGYRNRRVVVFDPDTGAFKRMWGAYGEKADDSIPWKFNPAGTDQPPSKQFQTVTGVSVSRDGLVYVGDRSNNRIQVFKRDGTFLMEKFILPKTPRGTVDTIAFSTDPAQQFLYNADPRNMRIWILRRSDMEILGHFGQGGHFGGQFNSSAYVVTDKKGNLYVGEGVDGRRVQRFLYKGLRKATATR